MPRDENMIAALKRERAGYVARGLEDRVAEVDKQLKHYGYEPATPDQGAPEGRTTPEEAKQTAAKPEPPKQTEPAKPASQTAAQKRAAGGKD